MSRDQTSGDGLPSRREILKGIGGGVGAATVVTASASSASAKEKLSEEEREAREQLSQNRDAVVERAREAYENPETVRTRIAETSGPLLEDLAEDGLIDSADVDALELGEFVDPDQFDLREPADTYTVEAEFSGSVGTELVPSIVTTVQTDSEVVHVHFLPGHRSFAVAHSLVDESVTIYDPDNFASRTSDECSGEIRTWCDGGCNCNWLLCWNQYYYRYCDTDSGGYRILNKCGC